MAVLAIEGYGAGRLTGIDLRRHNGQQRRARLAAARARGTHSAAEWLGLLVRYGARCVRCGAGGERLQRDHIIPVYQEGSDAIANIQPLCRRCNCAKGPERTNWRAYRDAHGFEDGSR